jgi:hypothetical protein
MPPVASRSTTGCDRSASASRRTTSRSTGTRSSNASAIDGESVRWQRGFYLRAVSLPIFPRMTDADLDSCIDRVLQAARETL